jgi:carboxypeptidase Q
MKEMPVSVGGGGEQFSADRIAEFRKAQELRRKAQQFFIDEGALAIIHTHRGGGHGTFFTTNGASYAVDAPEVLPEMEIAVEHYNRMVRLLEKGVPVKVEMDSKTKFLDDDLNGYNVLAEIAGTDPKLKEEVVMLGAHLDSWFAGTGATDNAAGSAVMMEAMRILKTLGVKPRRTIRVALWGSEEQGLYGSRNYVRKNFTQDGQNVPNEMHGKLSAYYNIDNGTGKIRGIYTQGNDAAKPIFEEWFKPFHDMGAGTITIRNTGGTDHQAFDGVGLPGFQFIQDPIDYSTRTHHTNMDVYERLQEADLKQMAVIVASMVYHTAMRDEKIPRKPRATAN